MATTKNMLNNNQHNDIDYNSINAKNLEYIFLQWIRR